MTNFVNIKLPANVVPDPRLDPLVKKLALDRPQWTFILKKSSNHRLGRALFKHQIDDPSVSAPDGGSFAQFLDVFEDNDMLGIIGVEFKYSYKKSQRYTFFLESHRITKSRSKQTSMKMEIIARAAKNVLSKRSLEEMASEAQSDIVSNYNNALSMLTRPIYGLSLIKDRAQLQQYAFVMANEIDGDLTKFRAVTDQLRSPEYEKAMAEFELGSYMDSIRPTMICVSDVDGMFLVAPINEAEKARLLEYEAMPEKMQERVAVLRLCQDHEVVRDVGFRENESQFLVCP